MPLKSNAEQLRQRGFASDNDVLEYADSGEQKIMELLSSREAYKRTIGIKLLSKQKNEKHLPLLCETLKTEKKLYTKIALCECLGLFEEPVGLVAVRQVGRGDDHVKEISIVDLDKKSFPLPRDISARILIRIGPGVFSELKKLLQENKNRKQITEAVDVIGHVAWNFHDFSMEDTLLDFFHKNTQDDFTIWKLIRSFQSFPSAKVITILEDVIANHHHEVIVKEAERSLDRIKRRSI